MVVIDMKIEMLFMESNAVQNSGPDPFIPIRSFLCRHHAGLLEELVETERLLDGGYGIELKHCLTCADPPMVPPEVAYRPTTSRI